MRSIFGGFVELGALEDGIEALDGGDADVGALVDEARFEPLHRVQLGEFAVIVDGDVGHHFLLGLLAEVLGVDQEEHTFGVGVLEQAVDAGDGGVGLAGADRVGEQGAAVGEDACDRGALVVARGDFFGGDARSVRHSRHRP